MKKAILIFLLIIGVTVAKAQDSDAEGPKLPPDLDMLTYFYKTYISSFNDGGDPRLITRKQVFLRRGFFTERGLKRYQQLYEETNTDPIIKAQEAYRESVNSLQVTKDPKLANRYKITYDVPAKTTVELSLVKEKGEWKIDYLY